MASITRTFSAPEKRKRSATTFEPAQPRGGDHGGVVRGQRQSRYEDGNTLDLSSRGSVGAKPAVRGNAPRDADTPRTEAARGFEGPLDKALNHNTLKTCAKVRDVLPAQWSTIREILLLSKRSTSYSHVAFSPSAPSRIESDKSNFVVPL